MGSSGLQRARAATLALLLLGAGRQAAALDLTLPGERQVEVHGWLETRLSGVGDDFSGGMDLSRFWHVADLEVDLGLFPDGIGPFQSVSAFARALASYECVYSHGCGLFESTDSWGDRARVLAAEFDTARFIQRSGTITVRTEPANGGTRRLLAAWPPPDLAFAESIARGEVVESDPRFAECDVNDDDLCNTVDATMIARGEAEGGDRRGTAFPASFSDLDNFLAYIDLFGLASTRQHNLGFTSGTNIPYLPQFRLNVVGGNGLRGAADLTAARVGDLEVAPPLPPLVSRPPMPCPKGIEGAVIPRNRNGANVVAFDTNPPPGTELEAVPVEADQLQGCLGYEHPAERSYYTRTHSALGNLPINFRESEIAWDHGYSSDEHELRELYVDMELLQGDLFLRMGKQIVVWGKTELFRNQDRWNPSDLSQGTLPSLEEVRIPQWMARAVWSVYDVGPLSNVRLETVLNVDDFEPVDFGFCGESTGINNAACALKFGVASHGLFGLGVAGMELPEAIWNDWSEWEGLEIGERLEFIYKRATFALTAYYGWDDTPIAEVVASYDRLVDPASGRLLTRAGGSCAEGTEPDCLIRTDLDRETKAFNPVLGGEVTEFDANVLLRDTTNQRLFHLINSAGARLLELEEQIALPLVFDAFLNGMPISRAFNFIEPEVEARLAELHPDDLEQARADLRSGRKALFGCGPLLDPSGGVLARCEVFDLSRAEASVLFQEWDSVIQAELGAPVGSRSLEELRARSCPPGQESFQGICTVLGVIPGFDDRVDSKPEGGCQFDVRFVGNRFQVVGVTPGCTVLEAMSEQLQLGTFLIGGILPDLDEDERLACQGRDPLECPVIRALLATSGLRAPVKRAGGNGAIGRRDFTWHGAESIGLAYQKLPVFGFAMDFPEDRTQTNWSLELSYTPDRLFTNTLEPDGLSEGDDLVLSLSVTRSTFIRFLNPTNPFLFNVQTFFRYLPDHEGNGRSGTVVQPHPVGSLSTLFIATGYFQGRLTPGVVFVYDWSSDSGAVFAQLGYRFTNNLSAVVALRGFFARPTHGDQGLVQLLLGNDPSYTGDGFRGLSSFRSRDEVALRIRYTF